MRANESSQVSAFQILIEIAYILGLQTKDLICDICGKAFGYPSYLTAHKKWHNEGWKSRYKCPYCEYKNPRKIRMKQHILKRHNVVVDTKDFTNLEVMTKDTTNATGNPPTGGAPLEAGLTGDNNVMTHALDFFN